MSAHAPADYFDANAAVPVHPAAWAAYRAAALGPQDAAAWAAVLADLATALGVSTASLHPCSGGTEGAALALCGALAAQPGPAHVLTTCLEHSAVAATLAQQVQRRPVQLTTLAVPRQGAVEPAAVAAALRSDTRLVSVCAACSETGVLQPIAALAQLCRARGVLLHVDAVQAVGRVHLPPDLWGCDLLSLSAHKLGSVGGVGLLVLRPATPWQRPWPLLAGPAAEEPADLPGLAALAHRLRAAQARTAAGPAPPWRDRVRGAAAGGPCPRSSCWGPRCHVCPTPAVCACPAAPPRPC